MRKNKNKDNSS